MPQPRATGVVLPEKEGFLKATTKSYVNTGNKGFEKLPNEIKNNLG
jgi:hypothetical protein